VFLLFFLFRFSLASTNVFANAIPKAILSEHPDHSKPWSLGPLTVLSQPHWVKRPLLQALVTAWATPADDSACTNDASLVPEKIIALLWWYYYYRIVHFWLRWWTHFLKLFIHLWLSIIYKTVKYIDLSDNISWRVLDFDT
jgi:hypothetical protein